GIANGMRAGRASGRRGRIRPFGAAADRYMARSQINNGGGNKKGRNAPGSVRQQRQVLPFDYLEPADPAADINSHTLFVFRRYFQAGTRQGEIRRRNGELDEAPHLLDFFFLDVLRGVEPLDFSRDLAGEGRGIELGDTRNTGLAHANRLPRRFGANPQRREQPHAGYYHSS